jgi:hypothetical protein
LDSGNDNQAIMEEADIVADGYVRGIRLPVLQSRDNVKESSVLGWRIPNPVVMARSTTTAACDDAQLCEKPAGGNMGAIIGCSVA